MSSKSPRRQALPLGVTRLEDRTLPASTITVTVGANGSGSLDGFLFDATPGVIASGDGGATPGTLSTGALVAVGPATNISVSCTDGMSFDDLGGTLALQTGVGRSVVLNSGGGTLDFTNGANTLATNGASIALTAGSTLGACVLNSGGGDVALTAAASAAGTLTARQILTAGTGNITLQTITGGAGSGTITQIGSAVGQVVAIAAAGSVTIDAVRGTTVVVGTTNGSVSSLAGNAIQSSGQLTMAATTGIAVNTLAGSVQASNTTSGNISIIQAAAQAQPLTTAGAGVRNQAAAGAVSITNLGDALTVAAGAPVQTSNGSVTLSALDVAIAGAVNSGTARTTLANSTAGRSIDLGTNAAGSIGLTQAELNNVTAGVLQVGSPTAGSVLVSAAVAAPAAWQTLTLLSGGDITEAAGGALTVPNLRIASPGPVSLTGTNNVGTLSAAIVGALLVANGTNPLAIGSVDGTSGVTTSGSTLTISANALDVQQAINAGSGTLTIRPAAFGIAVNLGGADGSGTLGLTDAELGRMTAGVLRVGSGFAGGVTVSGAITRHAGYGTLSLVDGGTVSQSAALSVANLAVQSTGGVTLTNAGNDVDTLAVVLNGSGNGVTYTDSNALAVGNVDLVNGIMTTGGPVTLTAAGAITDGNGTAVNVAATNLVVTAATGIDLDTAVGALSGSLTGNGPIALTQSVVAATINSLNAGTGTVTLDGGTFNLGNNNVIAAASSVNVAGTATLNLGSFSQGVAAVLVSGGTISGTGTLSSTNAVDVRSGTVGVKLGGSGGLTKSTAGTVILSGANTYTGTTTINAGTLLINGSQAAGSSVTVNTGGTLGGSGTVAAPVTVNTGGALAPGNSPGSLGTGNLDFASGATFTVDVNSPYNTAGTDYDRVNVTGTVNLNSATLNLVGGAVAPTIGKVLTIIANDGTDVVGGTFAGLSPGGTVVVGNFAATISYTGGDGNDVTLTTVIPPSAVVQSVTIDDGTPQRSLVRSVTVTFDRSVNFVGSQTAAFQVARTGPGAPTGNVTLAVDLSGSTPTQTVARLTFSGALTEGTNSLLDGNYTLTVFNSQIQGGVQGGDNVSTLFRLFGDVNGDKAINGLDLTAFRNAFGTISTDPGYVSFLDFNGDGAINGTDLTEFRNRFGVILP